MHMSIPLSAACLALGLWTALPAAAAKAENGPPPKRKAAAPKFIPSSTQESARERERRLLRECKGRPNAGACAGYAS
ncbi:hypothetical protein GCM10007320_61130 [Pseudorhodoferax aquiterrae]|uniref:PsiF repeat-containing protein n=2 Tax=Pseudorhodoferax aquiterrae TaxID=747304 RepID=A0ABQ3GEM7_9BURK|nr:hypothetical protein GCM10007320_61130 [Pseudorhodoferax aquiterrae]